MTSHTYPGTYSGAILIIGNEILSGRTQDTNTHWMAERLTAKGIVLGEVRVVPDDHEVIVAAVDELRLRFHYVFTTGGIGPTHDDITAEAMADAFSVPLVKNEEACRAMEQYYDSTGGLTDARLKMAMIPEGAALIPNSVSGAPGFIMENVYVMAGVPRIMQAMMDYVLGHIPGGKPVLSNTVSCRLLESVIANDLTQLQNKYEGIQIGSYPHYRGGEAGLSLVLRGTDQRTLEQATEEVVRLVRKHGDEPRAMSIRTVDS